MNLEDQADRDAALTVPCPLPPLGCAQPAGARCVVAATGELLERAPAHVARLRDAGVVHAPLLTREIRGA